MRESNIGTIFLGVITFILVGAVLYWLQGILKPFFVAIFLTVLFEPVMNGLRRLRVPKPVAVLVVLLLAFAFLFLIGLMVYASFSSFSDQFPAYEEKFFRALEGFLKLVHVPMQNFNQFLQEINWTEAVQKFSIPSLVSRSIGSFVGFLANVFLVLLFMIYALFGREYLFFRVQRAFEEARSERIAVMVRKIDDQIQRYLVTKTLISLATGVLATLIMMLLGVDFAVVWGVLTFLLNYIPNIGSTIATIPPILVALFQYGFTARPVTLAAALVALQVIMGNAVEPRVMGRSLDLSPLVVIFSLIFWGFLWGIVGMILAVPITATIKIIAGNIESLRPLSVLMSGVRTGDE